MKDDIKKISAGKECGIVIADFSDFQVDDIIQSFNFVDEE
jgi:translation initiation factor IF-2